MSTVATHPSTRSSDLGGKYMTFRLAGEDYGLQILNVRELIGVQEITRVPGAPTYLRGVLNLRGKVVPVIDLRLRFGMGAAEVTEQSVIIVVQVRHAGGELVIGALVDEVLEVRDIAAENTEPPPSLGINAVSPDFILGVGKVDRRVVFLLDVDRVLTPDQASTAAAVGAR